MDELSEHARKLIDAAMGQDDAPPPDASWGAFVEHMTSTHARSEEVLSSLPDPAAVRGAALGAQGIVEGIGKDQI